MELNEVLLFTRTEIATILHCPRMKVVNVLTGRAGSVTVKPAAYDRTRSRGMMRSRLLYRPTAVMHVAIELGVTDERSLLRLARLLSARRRAYASEAASRSA